ncbi:Circadian clock protein kinase KaiC [Usitatibacter rugosus]|uniref:non-specific serine/threonine protein kinase n=1 Tax=Usitatibacter rugosus TaxID=2732067 RepID=A0A6M4GVX3_9PROT|nr:circadian clock protein KaiC [Usitatibacter rugosus]QJR11165.1 Circadian clock protein kinase KaiC [Usitatibacter rugosus]
MMDANRINPRKSVKAPVKAPTGILGFDEITGGGLPRARTTLLVGGPGSGKTIFSLQFLVHGARHGKEPGIFVAFEEASERIESNAESFGWNMRQLRRDGKLYFLDAQPMADLVQSGTFDLSGMLAALGAQVAQMKAKRIVFDALDVVLALLPDEASKRREVYRLHEWLLAHGLTGLITAKSGGDEASSVGEQTFGFMQFMVDCAVMLCHGVVLGVSQRNLRVQKYRGTAFDENESPFLIGPTGLEVATAPTLGIEHAKVSNERISSGVARLDTMLGGGFYRGSAILVTGFPGTAKTTLSGAFAEAACLRGEQTLFVSFDSDVNEVVRDLGSVGIHLGPHVKSGVLRMASARTITGSAETYLVRIKSLAKTHKARCLVIDPVSTWSKSGSDQAAHSVAERLIGWTKANGITMLCTSLLDEIASQTEGGSSLQISTLADAWIHLSYVVQAGERNRGLSIIKSRGTAHSNQVRELILSDTGVTLTDTYTAGGEVLMGTLRWEKESAERVAHEVTEVATKLKRVRLDAEEAELEVRVKSLMVELEAKQVEKALLARTTEIQKRELSKGRTRMGELRGADVVPPK